jgi:ATP-binding cassette subfamily C protein LapB|tara:strand:+ start:267 stop:1958 length:1692 start_codon:yes stop_codon:yes gene_type:complete
MDTRQHWFWGSVANFKSLFMRIGLAAVMINLLSVASSIFIMVVYDRVIPNAAFPSLYALTGGMIIVLIFDFLLKNMRAWFIDLTGQEIDLQVGEDIYRRVLQAPLDKVAGPVGGLANTIRGFDQVREFFTSATLALVVDLPFVFLFVFVIYLISGPLAIIPLCAIPIVIGVGIIVQPFIARHAEKAAETGKSKYSLIIESLAGLDTIKTVNSSDIFLSKYQDTVNAGAESIRLSKVLSQLATNSASSAQLLSLVGIVFYGTFLIDQGIVSMGAMVAAVLLSSRALAPLAMIANLFGRLNNTRTAYRQLDQLMQSVELEQQTDLGIKVKNLGQIVWSRIGFNYPNATVPSLIEISASIEPGERIAIMGRNGSGKTTLIKLTAGMFQASQGAITYDNLGANEIEAITFREKLSVVLQEIYLFAGSIRENVLMGRENIDDQDLLQALECSGVNNFLPRIPGGLDAVLADRGQSLSAGQRQAIALARALVNKPEVLLMDEPTAALDLNSEQSFVQHLQPLLDGKTLITVTHRLPVLELVDRIIVLADGKIALDGPKDKVLEQLKGSK